MDALKKLTVAELMNIEVTSVSKSEEPRSGAAAALAVVTNEDIRRSGATTVADALRLVPGLHVARQTSSQWAISSRGFSSVNSEKLLVLSDTRSIYTPLFSGVLWDVQNYLLQDIDRIEVIRGPGATLWGSNAVNGVINITTKSAKDTQGVYAEVSGGTEDRVSMAARYGGRIGTDAYYRVFGAYFDRDGTFASTADTADDWRGGHVGFHADWQAGPRDIVTVQSEAYGGRIGQLTPAIAIEGRPGPVGRLRAHVGGGHVLGRWRRRMSPHSDLQLRAYYDRTHRNDPTFVDDLHTVDIDLQSRLAAARHDVTWGANYRATANRNTGKGLFGVDPPSSTDHLFSGFIQDQIAIRNTVRVTVGTKLEHNDFSGGEVQPSARVAWDVAAGQTAWAAVSRAVRVPTRLERDIAVDVSDPLGSLVFRLVGNDDFEAERLLAYESGYRWQAGESFAADVAVFHNRYRGLASLEPGTPFVEPTNRVIAPVLNENLNTGRATGAEALITYAPFGWSRFSTSYAYLEMSIEAGGLDINRGRFYDGATPRHQLGIRSSVDLPRQVEFDALFRRLSALRRLTTIQSGEGLPGYSELDLRVAWRSPKGLTLSVVGQSLLHGNHAEFGSPEMRGEIQRAIYGRIAWAFDAARRRTTARVKAGVR